MRPKIKRKKTQEEGKETQPSSKSHAPPPPKRHRNRSPRSENIRGKKEDAVKKIKKTHCLKKEKAVNPPTPKNQQKITSQGKSSA